MFKLIDSSAGTLAYYDSTAGAGINTPGASWSTTWSDATFDKDSDGADLSIRQVIPAADISTSGSTIRVTFECASDEGMEVDNVSIVERSGSSEDGTEAPTELLFSAASGFTIAASEEITSDQLSFSLDETKDYLLIYDIGSNAAADGVRYQDSSGTYYYKTGDTYNVQSPAGMSSATGVAGVNKIEVYV